MAILLNLGLAFWLLHRVSSQQPVPKIASTANGGCELLHGSELVNQEEMLTNSTGVNYTIHSSKFGCISPGLVKNKFNSLTLIVHYECFANWDKECPGDEGEGIALLSFTCDVESGRFVSRNRTVYLPYSSEAKLNSDLVAPFGQCGECEFVDKSQTGCIGKFLW